MRTKVKRWGNSLSVRIPKVIADEIGLKENAAIELFMKKNRIVILPLEKPKTSLKKLLSMVNETNLHAEVDTGKPEGGEAW